MANNKKRVLSLLMAAVMMLGTIPMNAFAFNSNNAASETRLVCENEKHHDHTSACGHKHNALCRLPQTSCYKRFRLACDHRGYHCGKSSEALECGFEAHNSNCYAAVEGDQKVDVNIDNILGNRELGVKIGKVITALTGLNAEKAASKNVLVRTALISAVQLSGLSKSQKNEVIGIIKSDENGMLSVIRWLWPTYTVQFVVDGVVVECDTVAHGAMPSFDSEEPAKTADAQYAYTFAGWDAEFTPVTGDVTYTAQFEENKPAVYENVKVKLTVNGVTRRIVKLGTVEHGTVITTQWLHDNKLMDINCYLANDVVIDRDGEFSVEFVDTNVTLVFWNGTDKMKTVTLLVANGIEITNQWLYDNNLLDSNYVLDENAAFEKVVDEAGEYNIFVRAK